MKFICLLLVALVTLSVVNASLTVYSPKELKDQFADTKGRMKVSYANFGHVPYGHSLVGRIYYDPNNADGCKPFGQFDYSKDPDDVPSPIIIVKRGGCHFVKKARNVEHGGGSLAVIIDSQAEDVNNVIMSDDGTGYGIKIPALLVGKHDGQKLIDFLEANGGTAIIDG